MPCAILIVWVILCIHPALAVLSREERLSVQTPIVLVHGFGGWRREFFPNYPYWGRHHGDYAQKLKEEGFRVLSAEIGPFSSNWDRACELFAVVKGGRVDYGRGHANKHKHKQDGRQHEEGLFKEWGETINGKVNKVHFIGHSMGGPTIRMLAHLLYHGVKSTPMEAMVDKSHPFYSGGKDWIDSITFLESPLTGLILADKLQLLQFIAYPALKFGELLSPFTGHPLDTHMDQWSIDAWEGLKYSVIRFLQGVVNIISLKAPFPDTASYSLTTTGAKEENNWVKNVDTILHFAYTTGHEREPENMAHSLTCLRNEVLTVSQKLINGLKKSTNHGIDQSDTTTLLPCQGNDGVVEKKSMLGLEIYKRVFGPTLDLSRGGTLHIFAHFDNFYHGYIMGGHPELDVLPLLRRHAAILKKPE